MTNQKTKKPHVGGVAFNKPSTLSSADKFDYTEKSDYWNEKDNFKLNTNITDFLMLHINMHGIGRSQDLVQAVSFIKRESEKLAFSQEDTE